MTQIWSWSRLICAAGAAATLGISGCARLMEPSPPPDSGPSVSVRDMPYDRSAWRWVKNPDGRQLLSHTAIEKCFIDPQPDQDFKDPGFTLKREEKAIGAARYEVVRVFQKQQLWSTVYTRAGTPRPALGVYSDGACRDAAERILQAHEDARGK